MIRLLRLYLLVCALAFNAAVGATIYLVSVSDGPLLEPTAGKLLKLLESRHPTVAAATRETLHSFGRTFGVRTVSASQQRQPRRSTPDRSFAPVPVLIAPDTSPPGRVLRVGANGEYSTPGAAAKAARDGDTIEIEPGDYPGDTAVWLADDLSIRGRGGIAWLDAKGTGLPQHKAIWVVQGDHATIENIAFLNARSRDRNGGGIRLGGTGLTVRNCYFFANETGILTGANRASDVLIEHSEFAWNGHADGQAHNIYVGNVRSFMFRFNYVHHAVIGSHVKSRAQTNRILYNRVMDERGGYGNYIVDLSNGGLALVVGNLFQQSAIGENYHMLSFAPEGASNDRQTLYVLNNTFVNDRDDGVFIRNAAPTPAHVYNNLLVGAGTATTGEVLGMSNLRVRSPRAANAVTEIARWTGDDNPTADFALANIDAHDYSLARSSPAVNAGTDLGERSALELTARYEYVHPRSARMRPRDGRIDIGAYEAR